MIDDLRVLRYTRTQKKIEKTRACAPIRRDTHIQKYTRLFSANELNPPRDVWYSLFSLLFLLTLHQGSHPRLSALSTSPRTLQMLSIIIIAILDRRVGCWSRCCDRCSPHSLRAKKPSSRGRSSSECRARMRRMGK